MSCQFCKIIRRVTSPRVTKPKAHKSDNFMSILQDYRKVHKSEGHKSEGSQVRKFRVNFARLLQGHKSDGSQVRNVIHPKGNKSDGSQFWLNNSQWISLEVGSPKGNKSEVFLFFVLLDWAGIINVWIGISEDCVAWAGIIAVWIGISADCAACTCVDVMVRWVIRLAVG